MLLDSYFSSEKHIPDKLIDKLGPICSFHASDFTCSICLAILSIKNLLILLINEIGFLRQLSILVFHDHKDFLLILGSKIIFLLMILRNGLFLLEIRNRLFHFLKDFIEKTQKAL